MATEAVYDLYDGFHYHNFGVSVCIDDAVSQPAPTQDSNWHTYDILYTYNSSSSGTITRYYDGSIWNTFTWSSSNHRNYGIFSSQHWFPRLWSALGANNTPMAVDWVKVWT